MLLVLSEENILFSCIIGYYHMILYFNHSINSLYSLYLSVF